MEHTKDHSIIPEGTLRCVWMDAGIVGFKLCDRFLQCEECPFDAITRERAGSREQEQQSRNAPEKPAGTADEQLSAFLSCFETADIPHDRLYWSNHTWFKQRDDGSYTVGLDHLAAYLLDSIHCLVLPQAPVHTKRFSPCLWVVEHEGQIALHTPVAGIMSSTNERLRDTPSLVTNSPYEAGWMFTLSPADGKTSLKSLIDWERAQKVFQLQAKILYRDFYARLTRMHTRIGATLYDGGNKVESLRELIGSRSYFDIVSRILALRTDPPQSPF